MAASSISATHMSGSNNNINNNNDTGSNNGAPDEVKTEGQNSNHDRDDDDDDDDGEELEALEARADTNFPKNPEQQKAFNLFVRLFVDDLDRLTPISKQPKEKINAIIQS